MDFTGWTAAQVWDFIEDPMNGAMDRNAAIQFWYGTYTDDYFNPEDAQGTTPMSGGGRKGELPPHG